MAGNTRSARTKAKQAAEAVKRKEGVTADPPPPAPFGLTGPAQEAWTTAMELASLYRNARDKVDQELTALTDRQQRLEQRERLAADTEEKIRADRAALDADQKTLGDERIRHADAEQALAEARVRLDRREKELNALAARVEEGRLDAEAGFLEQERVHLTRLAEQRGRLLADLETERASWYADIDQRRREFDDERRRQLAEIAGQHDSAARELEQRRAEIHAREARLAGRERDVRAMQENLEEDQAYQRKTAELAVAGQLKTLEVERDRAREECRVMAENALGLEKQLDQRDEVLRHVGHKSPEFMQNRLEQLEEENRRLMQELATVPASADPELLERIKREHEQCEVTRVRLEFDNAKLRSENNSFLIANDELEQLREHRDQLQHSVGVHKKLLSDAQAELDELVSRAHGPRPFPGLDELDEMAERETSPAVTDTPPDLRELVSYIQQRILADRKHRRGQVPLAYRDRDIRCLLGGLAMSRLHILQGISGIGKTTFPKAFAAAIGTEYEVIEVQAGWHDRQDLVGSLNAFERRYYETSFTKAVYQAGCAAYQSRPFFIILDEMNLAHPEQYFADILSGMENVGSPLRLQLTSHPVAPTARLLVTDKGVHLPVPENVWFFGTSNQDETTVQFADKTYDRAHVIELPTTPPDLDAVSCAARDRLSVKALQRSFKNAWRDHRELQDQVVRFLRENLAQPLTDDFGIAWGPRMEQQIRDFAPVVKAAGGSAGEAADHILATRILRRLHGRYTLRAEPLHELRNLIEKRWPDLAGSAEDPVETSALLGRLIEEKA